MSDEEETVDGEGADPSVPTDLLELHLELEEQDVSPSEFREAFGE